MSIVFALIPMFAWGSIGLVSGKLGGDANQQTLGMTIGAFLFSLIVFFVTMPTIDGWIVVIGLLGITALILLVTGAYLTARQDGEQMPETENKMLDFPRGFRSLISSTIGYGAYTIIITWAGIDPLAIILPQSIGMLIGASFFALRKTKVNRAVWKNTLSGLLWGIGNVCMLITVQQIGLAVGFSLSQMGIIISTLGGIFLLGEKKTKKEFKYVVFGCLLVIFGGILLGYMKAA